MSDQDLWMVVDSLRSKAKHRLSRSIDLNTDPVSRVRATGESKAYDDAADDLATALALRGVAR